MLAKVSRNLTSRIGRRAYTATAANLDELKVANKPKQTNIHHFKIYRWSPDVEGQDVSRFILFYSLFFSFSPFIFPLIYL